MNQQAAASPAAGAKPPRSWSRPLHRIGRSLFYAFYGNPFVIRFFVKHFHRIFFHIPDSRRAWRDTHWLGVRALKCPLDLWMYQEILDAVRPDLIVESGTASGGSALYLASICDLLDHGRILSIDIAARPERPVHPRITYLKGSSVSPEIVDRVRAEIPAAGRVLVILDSDHRRDHVLAELRLYAPLVCTGSYLIVEDTNLSGHPVALLYGPGPTEAVGQFLAENSDFQIDRSCERYYLTFNPGGYLKRIR